MATTTRLFCSHWVPPSTHHYWWPWRWDFPACCRPTFRLAGLRSSWVSNYIIPTQNSSCDAACRQNSL